MIKGIIILQYFKQESGIFIVIFPNKFLITDGEEDDILPDVYMGLIASYNLQFKDTSSNLVLEALSKVSSAKMLTEKLLLLLNREEDPAQLLGDPSQLLGEPSQQLGDPSQLQEDPGQLRQTE